MKHTIVVEQATIYHLNDLAELFNEYRMFYNQQSDLEGAREFLFSWFEHRDSIIFVALLSESMTPIAFTQLYPTFSSISMKRSFILNDLYVREQYRNLGAATKLLQAAKSFAIYMKAKGIEFATAVNNEKAQMLYVKNDYKKDEDFSIIIGMSEAKKRK